MWLKVALLVIYLAILFIITRFMETVIWYEQGQLSRRLLDPMTLSVMHLKAILEQRGVSYSSMVEKRELTELVEATGAVNEEELESASNVSPENEVQITNYTSDIDFYEQVEDAKDSMWLVEVIVQERALLADTSWYAIRNKVGKFGVRLGRFDCQRHISYCSKKSWVTSRLVLALPENYRSKANVALHNYTGPIRINALFDWIKGQVDKQIQVIDNEKELQEKWQGFQSSLSPDVRLVFVSTLTSVPLFLSALSVKFPGRVKIASVKANSPKGKQVAQKLDTKSMPMYAVVTKDKTYFYGLRTGEVMTFRAMELFLKSVYPNINDIFIVSIVLTNIAGSFEFSLSQGSFIRRSIKLLLCIFKYNIVLLLVWILLLGLLQLPFFEYLSLIGLKILRMCTLTTYFSYIRKDMLLYTQSLVRPILLLLVINSVVTVVRWLRRQDSVDLEEESDWWNFSNLRTLNYYNGWEMMRLRPFDQIFNPSFGGHNMEEEYQSGTVVNSDEYVKFLPVWVYKKSDCLCQCAKQTSCTNTENNEEKRNLHDTSEDNGNFVKSDCGENIADTSEYNKQLAASFLDSNYRCECHCIQTHRSVQGSTREAAHHGRSSEVWLEGQLHGSSVENPWNGQPHSTKYRKVENVNHHSQKPPGYLEDSQCVICLENYKDFVLLRGLPCRHVFHDKCILAWLLRENHFCPVCRWPSFQLKEWAVTNDLHNE